MFRCLATRRLMYFCGRRYCFNKCLAESCLCNLVSFGRPVPLDMPLHHHLTLPRKSKFGMLSDSLRRWGSLEIHRYRDRGAALCARVYHYLGTIWSSISPRRPQMASNLVEEYPKREPATPKMAVMASKEPFIVPKVTAESWSSAFLLSLCGCCSRSTSTKPQA